MVRATIILFLLLVLPSVAKAEKRVALVIGNAAYQGTPLLDNPKNDATDVAAVLRKHGFRVIEGFDLDKAAFDRKIRDFAIALAASDVGVFFYAGHGLQVSGQNYLVPIDAQLTTAAALDFEMVRLDLVHRTMEREARTNILFIDACRNNPLARNLARVMGTRSTEIGRGLAAVESGIGTLISFSTQPGNVALDGTGRNSPFARALVKHASTSNDDLGALLIDVRKDVMKETQRQQVPWEHSALTAKFYFTPPTAQEDQVEIALWDALSRTKNPALLQGYLDRYPKGKFAVEARAQIEVWRAEELQRAAEAKRAEELRRVEDAKRAEELVAAQQAAKKALEAVTAAELQRQEALKTLEGARKAPASDAGAEKVAALPKLDAPSGVFDGSWRVHRTSTNCGQKSWSFTFRVVNGAVSGSTAVSKIAGSVSTSGQLRITHTGTSDRNQPDEVPVSYSGLLRGHSGSGTFRKSANCNGTFTVTRL